MSVTSSIQPNSSWDEADQLISILRTWGIGYLVGEDRPVSPSGTARDQQSAVTLIRRLAQCEYPRVRDASISLFLLHPELAPAVLDAVQTSEPAVAEQITTLTGGTRFLLEIRPAAICRTLCCGAPTILSRAMGGKPCTFE